MLGLERQLSEPRFRRSCGATLFSSAIDTLDRAGQPESRQPFSFEYGNRKRVIIVDPASGIAEEKDVIIIRNRDLARVATAYRSQDRRRECINAISDFLSEQLNQLSDPRIAQNPAALALIKRNLSTIVRKAQRLGILNGGDPKSNQLLHDTIEVLQARETTPDTLKKTLQNLVTHVQTISAKLTEKIQSNFLKIATAIYRSLGGSKNRKTNDASFLALISTLTASLPRIAKSTERAQTQETQNVRDTISDNESRTGRTEPVSAILDEFGHAQKLKHESEKKKEELTEEAQDKMEYEKVSRALKKFPRLNASHVEWSRHLEQSSDSDIEAYLASVDAAIHPKAHKEDTAQRRSNENVA